MGEFLKSRLQLAIQNYNLECLRGFAVGKTTCFMHTASCIEARLSRWSCKSVQGSCGVNASRDANTGMNKSYLEQQRSSSGIHNAQLNLVEILTCILPECSEHRIWGRYELRIQISTSHCVDLPYTLVRLSRTRAGCLVKNSVTSRNALVSW